MYIFLLREKLLVKMAVFDLQLFKEAVPGLCSIYKDKKNKYPVKLEKLIAALRHVSKKVLLKELNKLLVSSEYDVFSTPAEIMTLLLSKDENPNKFLSIL